MIWMGGTGGAAAGCSGGGAAAAGYCGGWKGWAEAFGGRVLDPKGVGGTPGGG